MQSTAGDGGSNPGWRDSPFRLENESAYRVWRRVKLQTLDRAPKLHPVTLDDPARLRECERRALLDQIQIWNLALYQTADPDAVDKAALERLGRDLGLHRLDANPCSDRDHITSLTVRAGGRGADYIPYSSRPMSWHTDGYYNRTADPVRSFVLHCKRPAAVGGGNAFMDPEYVYLSLRDLNPHLVAALMATDALTVPENTLDRQARRPARTGPVYALDGPQGNLRMRYTARSRSILWKSGSLMKRARQALTEIMADADAAQRLRLQAGQGIIANNVLHQREGFHDSPGGAPGRLVYRARYHDRVHTTPPPPQPPRRRGSSIDA